MTDISEKWIQKQERFILAYGFMVGWLPWF